MNVNAISRKVAAEGCVLLKNDDNLLPFKERQRVAVFGRIQTCYYKSGTGSGGLVHIKKQPDVIESLRVNGVFSIDEELVEVYKNWVKKNPFNDGGGVWAGEPWYQKEMPIDEKTVKEASFRNDAAVIILGRTAGEDHDNSAQRGSYIITESEERLISIVSENFENVVLILNVGNIIDLSFLRQYRIKSVVYIWQGGMEGANALTDILSGKIPPSGKLCDTQVYDINDYPCKDNFGDKKRNIYSEDIYVGYRYFETFKKDAVQYPFGFGLTYTNFDITYDAVKAGEKITVTADVRNVGNLSGREVIQVYFKAPCGVLGTAERVLVGYKKTDYIRPGCSEKVEIEFDLSNMASYDESKSAFILQKGEYSIFAGVDVRSSRNVLSFKLDEVVLVKQLEEVLAPVTPFKVMCAEETVSGRVMIMRDATLSKIDIEKRISERLPEEIKVVGDRGIRLRDVKEGKNSLDDFISQFSDEDLSALLCSEGMGSPKATPGTGGAFGGQTQRLLKYGIPVCAMTDGPSGIRRDNKETASLVPNGACVASTWDDRLIEELYSYIGYELKEQKIDVLLGPGMNIHRYPLCGRNFEYFSEDPLITGKIAAAVSRGLAKSGSYCAIKHFCCNNQEVGRSSAESLVSERALREIYLKGFEIAVSEGENVLVMTSYGIVNGFYSSSNYDLNTTVLRKEWGFDGFVMTDWWAKGNLARYGEGNRDNVMGIVRAQNDLYAVCNDAQSKAVFILKGIKSGYITRAQLQRSVKNILKVILNTNTFEEFIKNGEKNLYFHEVKSTNLKRILAIKNMKAGEEYSLDVKNDGAVLFEFDFISSENSLSQSIVTLNVNKTQMILSVGGKANIFKRDIILEKGKYKLSLDCPDGIKLKKLTVYN